MELRDLVVTPLLLLLLYGVALVVQPHVTDFHTRRYFLPALTFKLIGALALGVIYQFYYSGGDTFNFHTHGSRHIWEAFMESPMAGLQLLAGNENQTGVYDYSSKIYFYHDSQSYVVIRIAAVFDLLTFSSYSATACLFAVLSFAGMWMFFLTFYKEYPHLHYPLALVSLFLPSVFFWGSGILKDTLTLAALGAATYSFHRLLIEKKFSLTTLLTLALACALIFQVKKFILQAYLPAVLVWIFGYHTGYIRSMLGRLLLVPVVLVLVSASAFWAAQKIGEDDERYSIQQLAKTARVTAYDIRYWTGRHAGSGYSLGELDGTFTSMIRLAPQAVNVTLFRPYLWEVKNPLMFLSALEAMAFLLATLYVLVTKRSLLFGALGSPHVLFCLFFSLAFAFAVGISTFNFGSLARYKIPLLPFYGVALVLLHHYRPPYLRESETHPLGD